MLWFTLLFVIVFFQLLFLLPRPLGELFREGGAIAVTAAGIGTATTTATGSGSAEIVAPPRRRGLWSERQVERDAMVETIRGYGFDDEEVLRVMARVPRHRFVTSWHSGQAYDDSPLPIGYGQTISQPFIVAEMTRLLQLSSTSRILEIGTGSGYQAAILSEFTPRVCSLEIIPELADQAAERLKNLGYDTVRVRSGDGWEGWPEGGPFDGIIVTCAAGQVPPPLIRQLAPGGRMVIPVGPPFATQWLMLVTKDLDGTVSTRSLMAVSFVPFVRRDERKP